ncbi:hypothetical protein B0H12DRAFT_86362 [Mycena haematopus]|nr:hypothetical protein B0H12DRAFT_86362 [Mycena haematopus]
MSTFHPARLLRPEFNRFVTAGLRTRRDITLASEARHKQLRIPLSQRKLHCMQRDARTVHPFDYRRCQCPCLLRTNQYLKHGSHRTCLLALALRLAEHGVLLTSSSLRARVSVPETSRTRRGSPRMHRVTALHNCPRRSQFRILADIGGDGAAASHRGVACREDRNTSADSGSTKVESGVPEIGCRSLTLTELTINIHQSSSVANSSLSSHRSSTSSHSISAAWTSIHQRFSRTIRTRPSCASRINLACSDPAAAFAGGLRLRREVPTSTTSRVKLRRLVCSSARSRSSHVHAVYEMHRWDSLEVAAAIVVRSTAPLCGDVGGGARRRRRRFGKDEVKIGGDRCGGDANGP